MTFKHIFSLLTVTLFVGAGCAAYTPNYTGDTAYWQRIETQSALYLTGVKAKQQLDEDSARCGAEVNELIRIKALRETTPPNTNAQYHDALNASGDLARFETPAHDRNLRVDHSGYYDFESCMRSQGWERVKSVRYQQDAVAQKNATYTRQQRKYGFFGGAIDALKGKRSVSTQAGTSELND